MALSAYLQSLVDIALEPDVSPGNLDARLGGMIGWRHALIAAYQSSAMPLPAYLQSLVDAAAESDISKGNLDTRLGGVDGFRHLILALLLSGAAGGGGGGITFQSGAPAGGDGTVGDVAVDTDTNILYEKTGVATWTVRGQMASSVTNTDANFKCPDTTTRSATLAA